MRSDGEKEFGRSEGEKGEEGRLGRKSKRKEFKRKRKIKIVGWRWVRIK